MLEQAGLPRQWTPWILLADQAIFAAMDVVTGYWADRVRAGLARLGGWILSLTAISCAAFLVLPFAGASAGVLLVAIVVWAVTSSALRSPPWALLSRHAAKPQVPWLSTLVLTGTAVAGAIAPYLGVALRGMDPRLPFAVSTLVLLAAVGGLVYAERRAAAVPPPPADPPDPHGNVAVFYAALLAMAVAFQVHFSLLSGNRYLLFAPAKDLPWLMPVFWIGFNLLMFPASKLVKTMGSLRVLALAAVLGALATLGTQVAPRLDALLAAQFLAGGCWGAACVAAYTAAVGFGRGGREGVFLGTLFAVLAAAAFIRIGIAAAGLASLPGVAWVPTAAWALGAFLLFAWRPRQGARARRA